MPVGIELVINEINLKYMYLPFLSPTPSKFGFIVHLHWVDMANDNIQHSDTNFSSNSCYFLAKEAKRIYYLFVYYKSVTTVYIILY